MRIWHEALIPKLCRQHLLAMWREGLGAYKIITENKKGYRNHPAVKEFENDMEYLKYIIAKTQQEMRNRGYKPKDLPWLPQLPYGYSYSVSPSTSPSTRSSWYKPWQTLEQQIAILKGKNCECKLDSIGGE